MSCSCHPDKPEEHLERAFAAVTQMLAESGRGLTIHQEITMREGLGLKLPHESEDDHV